MTKYQFAINYINPTLLINNCNILKQSYFCVRNKIANLGGAGSFEIVDLKEINWSWIKGIEICRRNKTILLVFYCNYRNGLLMRI